MKLIELSAAYRESAALLRARIQELRTLERGLTEAEAQRLRLRVHTLTPILREMQNLAELTAHYYDRSPDDHEKNVS